ncbi:group II intron reverse transcriptase domain-containing protein [Candidatus Uhrbacteria bacterium]|nr:group II intron reverse transcriptase domain-containing protein [Candidatus Uhrbacteria bacterium]
MKDKGIAQRASGGGSHHRIPSYDDVVSIENLFAAWRQFVKGKHARLEILAFERCLEDRLFALHDRLVRGTWSHGQYETFTVCDPKPRVIHKASVENRIVHHALVRIIEPVFDRSFIFDSWSCRKGKGTHAAVARLQTRLRCIAQKSRQPVWSLKCDMKKYFASVDGQVLLELIEEKIQDERLRELIRDIVHSHRPGLPLGNLTSQLFANVYLEPLDHFVQENVRAFAYLRYCDDFILIHTSREDLRQQVAPIEDFLQGRLRLELHPHKMFLRPWHWGVDWLGHVLYPDRVMLRKSSKQRMQNSLRTQVGYFLNGGRKDEKLLRATFASYSGLLRKTDEGDLKASVQTLWECL